ncbi:MAG TPA: DNA repair protein RadA [Nocardioidaceae bacterium]|nr:DNA repair protein RadA [Nocardioidaceae bacterium]
MTTSRAAQTAFRCRQCGWASVKWVGRCGECRSWGSVEEALPSTSQRGASRPCPPARPITSVAAEAAVSKPSGVAELDRVLGGGVVPGSVLLLAGEPGVGKSTLLLKVAARAARRGVRALYVSAEESAAQVRRRAERVGALEDRLLLAAETDLGSVLAQVEQADPGLLVVDSVQTVTAPEIAGVPGGVTQVRAVAAALVRVAKARQLPTLLVGHVTKDGALAGPRSLEHLVDVVLAFEGDPASRLRLLRAVKNRFGPVDEIGCFDLTEDGIVEVSDVSGLFVSHHREPIPGTCLTVTVDGRRAMVAEVQSLVDTASAPTARRAVSGLDPARVAMLLAVLQRRAGLRLAGTDVYAATVGGAALRSPAIDLAVALSLASAATGRPVPAKVVAVGEVGLAGELRKVPALPERLAEADRLGFSHALVPAGSGDGRVRAGSLLRVECADLASALSNLRLIPRTARPTTPGEAPALRVLRSQ